MSNSDSLEMWRKLFEFEQRQHIAYLGNDPDDKTHRKGVSEFTDDPQAIWVMVDKHLTNWAYHSRVPMIVSCPFNVDGLKYGTLLYLHEDHHRWVVREIKEHSTRATIGKRDMYNGDPLIYSHNDGMVYITHQGTGDSFEYLIADLPEGVELGYGFPLLIDPTSGRVTGVDPVIYKTID